jgi:hypothetical protein
MSSLGITSLQMTGYNGQPIPNRFFKHEQASTLALIFPGLRYTCDMPLLYYLTQVLLNNGIDVLQLNSDYTTESIKALQPAERLQVMVADAQSALETAFPDKGYLNLILAGKSIGTLPLALLLASGAATEAACIWLTPLLHYPFVVDSALQHSGPALFVASQADETFEAESMALIKKQKKIKAILSEEADHSLLIPGDIFKSLEIMDQVVHAYSDFVGSLFR